MTTYSPYHLRRSYGVVRRIGAVPPSGAGLSKANRKARADWPLEVFERWYPLYRLLKSPLFTDAEVGRLIGFKAAVYGVAVGAGSVGSGLEIEEMGKD